MTKKICKYGCGQELEWDNEQSAFKETQTGLYHDKNRCSKLKVNNPQPQTTITRTQAKIIPTTTTTTQSIPINNPTLEGVILYQISQKLDLMKKQMEEAIETKLVEILEYCRNNNLMGDAMVAHFGITQPTTAAELWKKQMEQEEEQQQQQQQQPQVKGWNSVPNPTDQYIPNTENNEEDIDPSDKELEDHGI